MGLFAVRAKQIWISCMRRSKICCLKFCPYWLLVCVVLTLCGLVVMRTEELQDVLSNYRLEDTVSISPDPARQQARYNMSQLAADDYNRLVDIDHFRFTMNNFPCSRTASSSLLLVLVHSAPGNFQKRRIIRETWGQPVSDDRYSLRVLFMLGQTNNPDSQIALEEENRNHRDLIQGSFQDAYRNLTYKHVMALKWTTYFCWEARFLLKTDDDVFVNTPLLLDYLFGTKPRWESRDLILCNLNVRALIQRNSKNKWVVTSHEYGGRTYPTYCNGWVILYSPDVVFQLYQEVQKPEHKYFWIDDVHITGTMAKIMKLTHTPIGRYTLTAAEIKRFKTKNISLSSFGPKIFGNIMPPNYNTTAYRLWDSAIETNHLLESQNGSKLSPSKSFPVLENNQSTISPK